MKGAIGGFFELNTDCGEPYYEGVQGLNSARSAFAWCLQNRKIKKIFLPDFNCPAMLKVATDLGVGVRLYNVDDRLQSQQLIDVAEDCWVLYVNYFGLQDSYISQTLLPRFKGKLILDNAQALFSTPISEVPTIYSPRKFIGVPDGGWLVDGYVVNGPAEQGRSSHRCVALLGRVEDGPEAYYSAFQAAEASIAEEGVAGMSDITAALIAKTDLHLVSVKRVQNFTALHQSLSSFNSLFVNSESFVKGALSYPLLLDDPLLASRLREELRARRIYIPIYWPGLATTTAAQLSQRLLPLPVDQRYGLEDMAYIASEVRRILNYFRDW